MRYVTALLSLALLSCGSSEATAPEPEATVVDGVCYATADSGSCTSETYTLTGEASADLDAALGFLRDGYECTPDDAGATWSCSLCPKIPPIRGRPPRG